MSLAFIDEMRAQGHAVESVCRVLREQGCQIAARTYRVWKQQGRPVAARTISDAIVRRPSASAPRSFTTAPTIADVEYATAGWVDWYNNRRLLATLGMNTPTEFETAHYAALTEQVQPA